MVDEAFGLWNTRSSRGTTTAAAIMIRSIRSIRKKPQHGRPQQRRRLFGCFLELGTSGPFEPSYGKGHVDIARVGVPPRVGVPKPGGGNAESMPERPD